MLTMDPHPADTEQPRPHPHGRAVSGAITSITTRSGVEVAVLRADYDVLSPRGGWTVHGYAWRCPCGRLALGYGPHDGFGAALSDARVHECGVPDAQ